LLRAVSLFSNCGAGDVGFRRAGFRFDVLAEIDARRLAVAQLNHPEAATVHGDLRLTWNRVVECYQGRAGTEAPALLAACPPCQGMSNARGDRGSGSDPDAGSRDERNLLVLPIANVAKALRPRAIVVENVPAFLTRRVRDPLSGLGISAAQLLINILQHDYEVFPITTDLADFGVPQTRRRAFLTFIRRDEEALTLLREAAKTPYPKPTHGTPGATRSHMSLGRALGVARLTSLDARSSCLSQDRYESMHFVPTWSDRRYPMIAAIPSGSGRSAWQNDQCGNCWSVSCDMDAAVCSNCGIALLRPIVRQADGTIRLIKGFRASSYRRMVTNKPASTVTTASGHIGSDRTLHPTENRVLSPLECAILQTIPATFAWGDTLERFGHSFIREMIGEAVPPRFTARHGRVLSMLLRKKITSLLDLDDARCARARRRVGINLRQPVT
jgi:DNA (cytosine-5)-methyltransferase 1